MEAYIQEILTESDRVVVRMSGCDYKCPYCNAPDLVEFQTGGLLDVREAEHLIDEAGKGTVLFTGGEPLLQRQALLSLLRHCRAKGLRTVVDTNASKPETVKVLLDERLVDEFLVDAKAPLSAFQKVTRAATFFKPAEELFAAFQESLALLAQRPEGVRLSFRTVLVPGLLYKKEELLELAALLAPCRAPWHLVPFDPEVTLDPRLRSVTPPSDRFLVTLQGFLVKAHPQLQILLGGEETTGDVRH